MHVLISILKNSSEQLLPLRRILCGQGQEWEEDLIFTVYFSNLLVLFHINMCIIKHLVVVIYSVKLW